MEYRNNKQKKYLMEKGKIKDTFPCAYDFLEHIENHIVDGFHIGTNKHLHLYYQQYFLFYFEFLTSKSIRITSKQNGIIKKGTTNEKSKTFFQIISELIALSSMTIEFSQSEDRYVLIIYSTDGKDIFDLMYKALSRVPIELMGEMIYAEEIPTEYEKQFPEGAKKIITVNYYERNREARTQCIKHYGATCSVCGFDFENMYGEIGKGFIHVHHEIPVSNIGKNYEVNPIEDLKPVCPNCHAMLHHGDSVRTIEELKKVLHK